MRTTLVALVVSLLAHSSAPAAVLQAAPAPPATDIYLAALDLAVDPPAIGAPRNLTDRDGYDNQPVFVDDGGALLYTSSRDGQTDIWRIDLASGAASAVTGTSESEYSPLPIPGSDAIAVVRVESDGTQRLWSVASDGSTSLLFEALRPVGYHAWNANGDVAMFVLGEPASLWLGRPGAAEAPRQVAADIGRSLQPIPNGTDFSFLQRIDGAWQLRRLRPDGTLQSIGAPLDGSQDLAWCPDGRALMARGGQIWARDEEAWRPAADLSTAGIVDITRLAVSPDGRWLAFVAGH